jgi:D-psicose/D-tagatose/L-ribulose 3-epimerase
MAKVDKQPHCSSIGIGCNTWLWVSPFRDQDVGLLERIASFGFDSVTVPIEQPGDFDPGRVRAAADQYGLRVHATGAYSAERDLTHDDPEVRSSALAYIEKSAAIASEMGATLLVGPAYSAVGKRRHIPESQRRLEWQRAVEGLSLAGDSVARYGVRMAVEPLNRFETDLVNTISQGVDLIDTINHDHVQLHLDTFHAHIEEKDLYSAILQAGKRLIYVDASECDRGTPGSGQVDWLGLKAGLEAIDYSGDCVIETFTPECLTIAAAAAIWRPLASSQNDIARDGYRFLEQLLREPTERLTSIERDLNPNNKENLHDCVNLRPAASVLNR